MPEIQTRIVQIGDTMTSEASIRGHTIRIDRPQAKGGTDQGAMGGELLLAALGGCFISNLIAAIQAREADIGDLCVIVRGDLDGTPPVYQSIDLEVSAKGTDLDQLDKLVEMSERACIVSNTLKSGTRISTTVVG